MFTDFTQPCVDSKLNMLYQFQTKIVIEWVLKSPCSLLSLKTWFWSGQNWIETDEVLKDGDLLDSKLRLIPQCNTLCLYFEALHRRISLKNQRAVTFQHFVCHRVSCDLWAVLSTLSWGHNPCSSSSSSSSDSDEASLVAADWLRHHAATPPPGHTPLPVEFGITPKPWKIRNNLSSE